MTKLSSSGAFHKNFIIQLVIVTNCKLIIQHAWLQLNHNEVQCESSMLTEYSLHHFRLQTNLDVVPLGPYEE